MSAKKAYPPITTLPQIMPNVDMIPGQNAATKINKKHHFLSDSLKMYPNIPHFAAMMPISSEDEIQDPKIAGLASKYHNMLAHSGHGHRDHGNNHGKEHGGGQRNRVADNLSESRNSRNFGHLATSDAHFANIQELERGSNTLEHEHDFEKLDLRLTKRAERVFNELVEDNKMLHQQLKRLQTHCFA